MRIATGLSLLCIAYVLAGCGSSPQQDVRDKVQQFAQATAHRDYRTLCTQVLAPALVSRLEAAGLTCDQAMKVFANSVTDPTINISKITVQGSRASAVVLAAAQRQTAAVETIQLVQTGKGWRLASLATPR
jgi:hypothetical protein